MFEGWAKGGELGSTYERGGKKEETPYDNTQMFLLPSLFVFLGPHPVFFIDTTVVFFFFRKH